MKFNCGTDQQLIKVIRGGEPQKHQDTTLWGMQYYSFLGWAKNLLKFQKTENREVAPQEHRSKGARSIQRGKKKRLCESPFHDFGSKKNEARLKEKISIL